MNFWGEILSILGAASAAWAGGESKVAELLEKEFPNTQIEIASKAPDNLVLPILNRLDPRGYVVISDHGKEFYVEYHAWQEAYVAQRTLRPREKIDVANLRLERLDLSRGEPRLYRGLLLTKDALKPGLETMQTIPESQMVLLSALQKVPDVRTGDFVNVQIQVGQLILHSPAIVQENASVGDSVRVLTKETKKLLTGKLIEGNHVEVSL